MSIPSHGMADLSGPLLTVVRDKKSEATGMSQVVKAFNSIGSGYMYKPRFEDGQPTMFICGNNDEAKSTVTGILEKFGWDVMDSGGIEASNALEGLCIIWCARGFKEGLWNQAFKLMKK